MNPPKLYSVTSSVSSDQSFNEFGLSRLRLAQFSQLKFGFAFVGYGRHREMAWVYKSIGHCWWHCFAHIYYILGTSDFDAQMSGIKI